MADVGHFHLPALEVDEYKMSYTVLARKWRPRTFSEMAGQEHVRRALANALDENRLHHAFLFSGTRGVGKTTIARILAKCLNCEKGVTSEPCGACANCREIDEGRFVDLIEVDAASRTKVDDTRELLDNVQYKPTRGVFKVYLIDEVHMLSRHSFNALLKTLEEPPEHVKFLLATTDPQKLPVTVLSRCLQFNLKKLPVDLIAERLQQICKSEEVTADDPGIMRLARAAAGSMRDGLSLLDQAIAYGGGKIEDTDVRAMLGTIDRQDVAGLLEAVARGDAQAVMDGVAAMDEHAPDYEAALIEMAALIQRAALAQAVPNAIDDSRGDRELVTGLAGDVTAESLQLFYQIALIGRRDLYLAADPRGGFEMVMLRMLAFRPAGPDDIARAPAAPAATPPPSGKRRSATRKHKAAPGNEPAPLAPDTDAAAPAARPSKAVASGPQSHDWSQMLDKLNVRGATRELAANCQLDRVEGTVWHLVLDERHAHLLTENLRVRLGKALAKVAGDDAQLRIRQGQPPAATPAAEQEKSQEDRQDQARAAIDSDQNLQALKETFDATVLEDSVRPVDDDDGKESGELF